MAIPGIRGPAVFVSLLALGAWAGSTLAHGAGLPGVSVSVPGVTVPSITATAPVVGVSAATPSVTATVPVVNATVPSVTAPSVTTTVPSVGVTVPPATVSTPVAGVTTPTVTAATPAVPVVTPSPVPAPKPSAAVSAANAATSGLPTVTAPTTVSSAVAPVVSASKTATSAANTATTATKTAAKTTTPATSASASSTATTRPATTAARTRTARLRAARLQAARLRAARARRIRLERAARERQRILRAQRAAQTPSPLPTAAPVLDPTTLFFIDPAQPLVMGLAPYQTPEAAAAAIDPVAAALLPISTAAAAALLPGVSARASSTLYATAPPVPVLAPSGGFNGASRFEMFVLARFAPVQSITPGDVTTPVTSRAPVLSDASGGRVLEAVAGGGRDIGLNTPFGHVSISHGDYVFGSTRYPIASARGVLTTALIALGVLAGIAGLLAAGAAADRFLAASGRRGSERTREDLYAAAKRKNIPGRSRMSKAELRRALDDW